jgi:phytoene dehydrogenase-like protein
LTEIADVTYDYILIGTGINSLVCGAVLSKSGAKVLFLERSDQAGGCIRTEQLTLPGFTHDVLSGWHPLFVLSPAYEELAEELHARGLTYCNTDKPTGVVMPSGESLVLSTDREVNLQTFNAFGATNAEGYLNAVKSIEESADLTFGLLNSELRKFGTAMFLLNQIRKRGIANTIEFFGQALGTCADWLESSFTSPLVRSLYAPWILHTGLSPEDALSGHMGKLIAFSLETAGMPVVKGGSANLVRAFKSLIEDNGGVIKCEADVDEIMVSGTKAKGVILTSGQSLQASKAVIANVTPTQLYQRLLRNTSIPENVSKAANQFRYGRSNMQIHLALDARPEWVDCQLNDVPMIHVTEGINSICESINAADTGHLPRRPTIVVGQPAALDKSRVPEGKWILWLQLQELPRQVLGDAAGIISVPESGEWTEALREAYADRVMDRLAQVIPGLSERILKRVVLSPADLERLNINLVGGDPYSGDCKLDQNLLWRPLTATRNHETPIKNLYHIGASTHPGPGLGGGSGYQVGKILA